MKLKQIILLALVLLASATAFGQTNSGFIKTSPVREMILGFELSDSTLVMSVNILGGTITQERRLVRI